MIAPNDPTKQKSLLVTLSSFDSCHILETSLAFQFVQEQMITF